MTSITRNNTSKFSGTLRFLSAGFAAAIISITSFAQTPSPSPAADSDGRYSVKASTEIGGRWVDVNGFENKFRSDLNYKSGFRVFDSSFVLEDNSDGPKAFDSALVMASGFGSDPSGFFRANVERDGIYRIDTNVRRVTYFNALNNHSIGDTRVSLDRYSTVRNFGDVDLTILPDNRKIRFRVGGSYNTSNGPFVYTTRQSNAFPFYAEGNTRAYDFRAGVDGSILGFNLTGTYGYRTFKDRTTYTLTGPEEGSNNDNYDFISSQRANPLDGRTHFGVFSVQRTFADKFDFTARILHSKTSNEFSWFETASVYYNSTTVITNEQFNISGESSRPQTRGDLGMTWRVTDKFRISNTFTYDGFNLNGGNLYLLASTRSPSRQHNYTFTKYRRYVNLLEGDYQFNNRFSVNLGYRYTRREFELLWTAFNLRNNPPTLVGGSGVIEEGDNTTNTFIAGTRIKPMKNWAIYANIEKGKADNVITRAGNADFTNFKIRSQMRFDKVAANVSFITKDNELPTDVTTSPGNPRITETRSRAFSATLDWYPIDELNLSGGYNYLHLTSLATVNFQNYLVNAPSEYFVRDSYYFIDATVKPHKRLTFFGSYRWNKDRGHDDRQIPALGANYILGGYKFDFKTPEFRAAIRLNKYVDWNIGYQYYDYKEEPVQNIQWAVPFQNYSAHMPYTSIRIYLGRGAGDR